MAGKHMFIRIFILLLAICNQSLNAHRSVGKLNEVFAWKQITYNIDGVIVDRDLSELQPYETDELRVARQVQDRGHEELESVRDKEGRKTSTSDRVVFVDPPGTDDETFRPSHGMYRPSNGAGVSGANHDPVTRPQLAQTGALTSNGSNNDNSSVPASQFFIQYNNVPMGVERWRNMLFVTMPRRRYGIPSTLNYVELRTDGGQRSPHLKPYPSLRAARSVPLVSVYRTRVDKCDRLWMVDTGLLEVPGENQQLQPPAIVVFDLKTDQLLMRYQLKETDFVTNRTSAGLASITVDVWGGCDDTHTYIVDLATYGLIVFSLRERDSWRVSHNYFSFDPNAGDLNVAGQTFQWNDGVFSLTLSDVQPDGYKLAYFHPMASLQEFLVSTRVLRNRTLATRSYHEQDFQMLGLRGPRTQSTMHGFHKRSRTILYAVIAQDAIACWNTMLPLNSETFSILAQDHTDLIYPSDLHVYEDEVWVMTNTMPRFIYSTLDPSIYNFHIYRGNINEMLADTACDPRRSKI